MRICITFMALTLGLLPVSARNFAVPSDDPVMTMKIPDAWSVEDIDYGFSASDPDSDVKLYVESADGKKNADDMMKLNRKWMAEEKIVTEGKPDERTVKFGAETVTLYTFAAKDSDGPTIIQYFVVPAKNDRVILLTVWGSKEQQAKHQEELDAVYDSIKPLE